MLPSKKRRASVACVNCRRRKIRCDISTRNGTCTRCHLGREECLITESRRGRYAQIPPNIARTWPVDSTNLRGPEFLYSEDIPREQPIALPAVSQVQNQESPQTRNENMSCDPSLLPAYLQPPPSSLTSEDINFLKLKKALCCPSDEIRNVLITSYISWVHSFCPVLDLHEFLPRVLSRDGSCGQVSLLVFQAVMFSGVSFAPIDTLANAGYSSREAAREDFFHRAKLLYDFGYEQDRIHIVQALLLMSYWQDRHDALQNHWYWVALANVVGRSISLSHEQGERLSLSAVRLRRRLGWTCFVRDRVLAIGLRQKPSLPLDELSLEALQLSDFEIRRFSEHVLSVFGDSKLLRDEGYQITLARLYIAKTQLCIILDRIFSDRYTNLTLRPTRTSEQAAALVEGNCDNVEIDHKIDLQKWLAELSDDCRYYPVSTAVLNTADGITLLHQAFLYMFYHTAHLALLQPELRGQETMASTMHRVRLSAVAITRVAEDLQNYGILSFLQSAAVSMLVRASVSHLYEYKAGDEAQHEQSVRRFLDCLSYLAQLAKVHMYGMFASSFLCYSARKLGISTQLVHGYPRLEYGIWEDVHTPERLFNHPSRTAHQGHSSPQPSEFDQNDSSLPVTRIRRERFPSRAHPFEPEAGTSVTTFNTTSTPSQPPSLVWEHMADLNLPIDPVYEDLAESWFRDFFEPLLQAQERTCSSANPDI